MVKVGGLMSYDPNLVASYRRGLLVKRRLDFRTGMSESAPFATSTLTFHAPSGDGPLTDWLFCRLVTRAIGSTDASGAFILVRKGKGHGDREDRFERHRRHGAHGFSHHREHSHGMRRFNSNQGFGNYSGFGGRNQNQPDGQN